MLAHRRHATKRNDQGTDIYLQLVDLSMRPVRPDTDTLTVRTTFGNE